MNLVADESVDFPIIAALHKHGHTVWAVVEMSPGVDDDTVLSLANTHHAPLLTEDKDFGELVFRLKRAHEGIVLLRLAGLAAGVKAELVSRIMAERSAEIPGAFTVIAPHSIRIRRR
jgi:predicted nuclease of predicted toxin-antitoxin system